MARRYARDNRGRFSSTGATARGGRLATASGKKRATQTKRIAGSEKNVISAKPKPSAKPIAAAPSTGASNIRRLGKSKAGHPRALRANAVRSYKPQTPEGQAAKLSRVVNRRIIQPIKDFRRDVSPVLKEAQALQLSMARRQARAFADRGTEGAKGSIARISMRAGGALNRAARDVIQRRAQRAADAAARGSKPAARARDIYANQLAFTGSGKAAKGSNNIQPGRGNTRPPKPRRRRK